MSVLFKIDTEDFTPYVVVGTYAVNNEEETETWVDLCGTTHHVFIRNRVRGSFDLAFKTVTPFNHFIATLESERNQDNYWPITVACNTDRISEYVSPRNIHARVTFAPSRDKTVEGDDIIRRFTVNIEEL